MLPVIFLCLEQCRNFPYTEVLLECRCACVLKRLLEASILGNKCVNKEINLCVFAIQAAATHRNSIGHAVFCNKGLKELVGLLSGQCVEHCCDAKENKGFLKR